MKFTYSLIFMLDFYSWFIYFRMWFLHQVHFHMRYVQMIHFSRDTDNSFLMWFWQMIHLFSRDSDMINLLHESHVTLTHLLTFLHMIHFSHSDSGCIYFHVILTLFIFNMILFSHVFLHMIRLLCVWFFTCDSHVSCWLFTYDILIRGFFFAEEDEDKEEEAHMKSMAFFSVLV